MIVAQEKRKQNIVEYILYMWQVEDLIRANGLDMGRIDQNIIVSYKLSDESLILEVRDWWENLTEMMRLEGKETAGHLQIAIHLANDLYNFHLELLTQSTEITYQNAFQMAYPDLMAFAARQPQEVKMHHIELALSAVYSVFLLKLKGVEIKTDTQNAIQRISRFLSILSVRYLADERGDKKAHEVEG